MARPLRLEIPDGAYHVWNRGVKRADIVFDDRDRFVDLLQVYSLSYGGPKANRRGAEETQRTQRIRRSILCASAVSF